MTPEEYFNRQRQRFLAKGNSPEVVDLVIGKMVGLYETYRDDGLTEKEAMFHTIKFINEQVAQITGFRAEDGQWKGRLN